MPPVASAEIVLQQLRGLPGGEALLAAAAERDDVELVGGAVRDLLLGREPRELDVVVGGDAAAFADELARRLNALAGQTSEERFKSSSHERFRTALVWWEGSRIDVATRRSECYPAPGALPEVGEGTPEEDLQRRDFTVNAIALSLGGTRRGELRAVPDALEDLSAGRLRVLHDGSFIDDPTRLFRLARYRARLGFAIENHTAGLAATAMSTRALATVSLARIGAELRLALSEADIVSAIASIDHLGLLRALPAELSFDEETIHKALALLSEAGGDTRPDLLLLAMLFVPAGYLLHGFISDEGRQQSVQLLAGLEFSAPDQDLMLKALADGPAIIHGLAFAKTHSAIYKVASRASPEGVAMAGGIAAAEFAVGDDNVVTEAARRWLTELRGIRLVITGVDLLAAGIPEGPEIGLRLEAALHRKLDGELAHPGRDAELTAALEAWV
jgi:tRNA nucleotidyltransferase (CCA-adding enzyme)